jgi:hypothetical protein
MGVRRKDHALSIHLQVERQPTCTLDSVSNQVIKTSKRDPSVTMQNPFRRVAVN